MQRELSRIRVKSRLPSPNRHERLQLIQKLNRFCLCLQMRIDSLFGPRRPVDCTIVSGCLNAVGGVLSREETRKIDRRYALKPEHDGVG